MDRAVHSLQPMSCWPCRDDFKKQGKRDELSIHPRAPDGTTTAGFQVCARYSIQSRRCPFCEEIFIPSFGWKTSLIELRIPCYTVIKVQKCIVTLKFSSFITQSAVRELVHFFVVWSPLAEIVSCYSCQLDPSADEKSSKLSVKSAWRLK